MSVTRVCNNYTYDLPARGRDCLYPYGPLETAYYSATACYILRVKVAVTYSGATCV